MSSSSVPLPPTDNMRRERWPLRPAYPPLRPCAAKNMRTLVAEEGEMGGE